MADSALQINEELNISDTMYKIQIFSILLSLVSSGYCQGAGGNSSSPVWLSSFISGTGIPVPGPREDPSGWCTLTKHYIEAFLQVTLFQRERLPNSAPGRKKQLNPLPPIPMKCCS